MRRAGVTHAENMEAYGAEASALGFIPRPCRQYLKPGQSFVLIDAKFLAGL